MRWPLSDWMCEEARGWIASGENRCADAIAHFNTAARRCSQAYDPARVALEAARLDGDRDQLLSVIDEYERMSAARAADRARAIARTLGIRPGRRRERHGVLSAREQEVAQLVAAGHTNREIAASLCLSHRTVERHIGNILTKLGYRSRVQVATEAAGGRLPGSAPGPTATASLKRVPRWVCREGLAWWMLEVGKGDLELCRVGPLRRPVTMRDRLGPLASVGSCSGESVVTADERELRAAGVTDKPQVVLADAGDWHQQQIERAMAAGKTVLTPPDFSRRKGQSSRPG